MGRRGGLPVSAPQCVGGVTSPWASPYGKPNSVQGCMPLVPGPKYLHGLWTGASLDPENLGHNDPITNLAGSYSALLAADGPTIVSVGPPLMGNTPSIAFDNSAPVGNASGIKNVDRSHTIWGGGLGALAMAWRLGPDSVARGTVRFIDTISGGASQGECQMAHLSTSSGKVNFTYYKSSGTDQVQVTGIGLAEDVVYAAILEFDPAVGSYGQWALSVYVNGILAGTDSVEAGEAVLGGAALTDFGGPAPNALDGWLHGPFLWSSHLAINTDAKKRQWLTGTSRVRFTDGPVAGDGLLTENWGGFLLAEDGGHLLQE